MRVSVGLLVLVLAQPLLAADDFDTTIPIPRSGRADLGWTTEKCSVKSVSLQHYPSAKNIEKARKSDPNDTSGVWWTFRVENAGTQCRIKLWVDVYGKDGEIVKSADKNEMVDGGMLDVYLTVPTRVKTIDIADSPKARLRAQITPIK
jgi:hypothetical protein